MAFVTPTDVSSVAIVLHGMIGIWSIPSSKVPRREQNLSAHASRVFAHHVGAPPKASDIEASVELWDLERWPHSLRVGFARFASESVKKHIIVPNQRAGLLVDVVLHSWHPELSLELDRMYQPTVSLHEPLQRSLDRVASHALSMKRGLELATRLRMHDLVMCLRFDLLFFSDVLLGALGNAPLYLPTWCHRHNLNGPQLARMSRACGGKGRGNAYVLIPPRVTSMHPRLAPRISRAADFDFAMLDWWLVAPPAIALTFGAIHDRFNEYRSHLRHALPGAPTESHYFWAFHVRHVLKLGDALRYIPDMVEASDFRLARQWLWGPHCRHTLHDAGAAPAAANDSHVLDNEGPLDSLGLPRSAWMRREGPDAERAPQCALGQRLLLFCPWHAPVCNASLQQEALRVEQDAVTAYEKTTRVKPIPKLWIPLRRRQELRAAGVWAKGTLRPKVFSRAARRAAGLGTSGARTLFGGGVPRGRSQLAKLANEKSARGSQST